MVSEADYLDINAAQAAEQWSAIRRRLWAPAGQRQVHFTPVETLLCLGASFRVNHRRYGGSTSHLAGFPVADLARLFKRPPSSILAKMANLDGSRRNSARHELLVGGKPEEDPTWYGGVYRLLLDTARDAGIGPTELPDFLEAGTSAGFQLLGQEELDRSELEDALSSELEKMMLTALPVDEAETERLLLSRARIGQHRFATEVIRNCSSQCVFCGLSLGHPPPPRMLVASHIKPWRVSDNSERLDHLNGVAACPTHDVAFDTGLLTIAADMTIVISSALAAKTAADPRVAASFGRPPLAEKLLLAPPGTVPRAAHLKWHRDNVFAPAS